MLSAYTHIVSWPPGQAGGAGKKKGVGAGGGGGGGGGGGAGGSFGAFSDSRKIRLIGGLLTGEQVFEVG